MTVCFIHKPRNYDTHIKKDLESMEYIQKGNGLIEKGNEFSIPGCGQTEASSVEREGNYGSI